MKIYAIDFDGTITVRSRFPEIGEPRIEFIEWLKSQQAEGAKLVLWTCRTGRLLDEAVKFCESFKLRFDAVNENLPEIIESFGTDTRKVFANVYIDDLNKTPWEVIDYKPKPKPEKPEIPRRKAKIVR